MEHDIPEEVQHAVGELSRILLAEDNLSAALRRVADLAVDVIPACDCCGVSLSTEGTVTTTVATSGLADKVDEAQYRANRGPCLTALRESYSVKVEDIASDDRWPEFAAAALTEGIVSSYSVPLLVDQGAVGALNLYSQSAPFESDHDRIASHLAAQAAITLANASAYQRMQQLVTNLRIALETRDVIGQAKGIIMERQRVTASDAFERLRRLSQQRNVKVHDLAMQIAETGAWDDPAEGGTG